MSFKVEVHNHGSWCDDRRRFATKKEAEGWGATNFPQWTHAPYRITYSADPINYPAPDPNEGDGGGD